MQAGGTRHPGPISGAYTEEEGAKNHVWMPTFVPCLLLLGVHTHLKAQRLGAQQLLMHLLPFTQGLAPVGYGRAMATCPYLAST